MNPIKLLALIIAIMNSFRPAEADRMFTSLAGSNIDFIFNGTVKCTFTGTDPSWDTPIFFSVTDPSNLSGDCPVGKIAINRNGGSASCTMSTSTPMRGNLFGTAGGTSVYPIIVNCEGTKIVPSTPFSSTP